MLIYTCGLWAKESLRPHFSEVSSAQLEGELPPYWFPKNSKPPLKFPIAEYCSCKVHSFFLFLSLRISGTPSGIHSRCTPRISDFTSGECQFLHFLLLKFSRLITLSPSSFFSLPLKTCYLPSPNPPPLRDQDCLLLGSPSLHATPKTSPNTPETWCE